MDKAIYAAKKLNSIIVLKSANTVIASQNNRVIINEIDLNGLQQPDPVMF